MKRTLIRNGVVVDGGGDPAFKGSLLLSDGRIEAVIKSHGETPEAERVIDAEGLAVSPGFIDMHSHSDWTLLSDRHPEMLSRLVEQGVTTVVGGNCGVSPAPVTSRSMGKLERMSSIVISTPFEYRWSAMAEFLEHVRQTRPIVNMAELVGHATARYMAADAPRGPMTEQELARSLDHVRRAFDEGAAGLSMGLGYDPGMYSPARELEAFCAAAAEADKPTAVHLKALSKISPCYPLTMLKAHNVQALEEMLDIARKTGVRLQLSHFIFVGRRSWSTADACIRMVEEARRDGVDVMIDAFPYFYGNTTIVAPIPYWFLKGTPGVYRSAMARARLKVELTLAFHLLGFYYKDFQLLDAAVPGWEDLNGLRLPKIAEKWGISPFDALLRLAEKSNGSALILFHTYSGEPGREEVLERVLSHDLCLFETDVLIRDSGRANPAGFGTFPRVLGKYVREKKLFSLENAVKRMTSASAARFGLDDIGLLEPGRAADVVVFDPETVSDAPPQGAGPDGGPAGIRHVFINGEPVVENGAYIPGARAGRVLVE